MTQLWQTAETFIWNIFHRMSLMDMLDILIVTVILYEALMITRQTRGGAVLKGVVFILLAALLSSLLGLHSLNWLLTTLLTNGVLALLILFQPELRKAMESIGRGTFFAHSLRKMSSEERQRMIDEIVLTMHDLSERKVGALIVFEQKTGLQDVIETGTALNARISAPLLENIFEPKTPLHDGAVIIRGDTIMAGACILPLTESRSVNRELGTRHRAGIGVTENSDAVVLIVSEETGAMSIARGGQIYRPLTEKKIRRELGKLYTEESRFDLLAALQRRLVEHVSEEEDT